MEQQACYDGRFGLGRSRTLREFVNRVCEQLLGLRFDSATAGAPGSWWEECTAPPAPVRRTARNASAPARTGQVEFSFIEAGADDAEQAVEPAVSADVVESPEPVVDNGLVRASVDQGWTGRKRSSPGPVSEEDAESRVETYARRIRYSGPVSMGKYLTANGTLDGRRVEGRRFKLPRCSFVPSLRLWNEPMDAAGSYMNVRFPPRELSSHGPRRVDGNLLIS